MSTIEQIYLRNSLEFCENGKENYLLQVVLQGQRAIAVQNMEKLLQLKTDATQQPLEFVEKLQQGQQ